MCHASFTYKRMYLFWQRARESNPVNCGQSAISAPIDLPPTVCCSRWALSLFMLMLLFIFGRTDRIRTCALRIKSPLCYLYTTIPFMYCTPDRLLCQAVCWGDVGIRTRLAGSQPTVLTVTLAPLLINCSLLFHQ